MDDKEVGKYWDENAENWIKLARLGYDKCRDLINSPAFFKMLPDIVNLKGLDIGCGEGYNTRIAAKKGAKITAIDISEVFITSAKESEKQEPLGIKYQVASAIELPFPDESFDFAIATMSLMDIADTEKALSQAFRVIKPNGFFQFSINHPCFKMTALSWVRNDEGKRTGFIVSDYFKQFEGEIEEWIFGAAPKEMTEKMRKFKIPRFRRILSDWLNMLLAQGFVLEEFCEPFPDDAVVKKYPGEYGSRIIPYFLIIRCRKPYK
ncbi:MAG: methyltransferase domain-containing protein [Candidatus Lokiarchaeota archaeon]|nr:methyltransferase domain-containing protein [Candidatus Lokiarchaeota archaeon]